MLRQLYPATSENADGISFATGSREKLTNREPPAIVWLPTSARHLPAEKMKTEPRELAARAMQVVAWCYGKDVDRVEQLVHDLIAILHKGSWGSYELGGETWSEDENTQHGLVALVQFSVRIPVHSSKRYKEVVPTKFAGDPQGSTQGDGVLQWKE